MSTVAILLCAGRGERLGAELPKAFVPLAGRPLFTWSLEALQRCDAIDGIVLVGPTRTIRELIAASGCSSAKIVGYSEGGEQRQHSVGRGLHVLPADATLVAVHDSARALVTPEVIAPSFEEFFGGEFLRSAATPYDTMMLQAREKFGALEISTHLVYTPSILIGGEEKIDNVTKIHGLFAERPNVPG